jgi:phosphoglycerate dehydrogenase-like enzyme
MNSTVRVLITVQFDEDLISQIEAVSPRLEVIIYPVSKAEEIPQETWQDVEVLYTHKILPEPGFAPDLKWIQFHRAGNERYLDAPILQKRNLVATSLSGASAPQVAEHVLEMILALGHHLPEAIELKRQGTWPEDREERFSPQELNQSTIGIVGYGSIGREVARLSQAFGATILAAKHDARHPDDPGYVLDGTGDPEGDFVHRLYPAQAVGSMLKECDFVVVCVPLTPETQNLIADPELAAMKPTASLVDISRGGVVNHADLIAALQEGIISGAALDVFPEEPLPKDSPLWELPHVILTPHIAGVTHHYDQRAVKLFIENLHRYLEGQLLLNQINLERGY